MPKTTKEVAVVASQEDIESVSGSFAVEPGFTQTYLPRLSMVSQDKTEGKGKAMKVITEAGMFITEHTTDEKDEENKNIKNIEEVGMEIEGTIVYNRKKLSFFDESTDSFVSSAVYDNDTEIIPLWSNKAEIGRGTPAELKALYPTTNKDGATHNKQGVPYSKLKDAKVLYVIYEDDLYELTIQGTSMYSFNDYTRKCRPSVPAVLTRFTSTAEENGAISWNKMQFEAVRTLTASEIATVKEHQDAIKASIEERKRFFGTDSEVDAQFAAHRSNALPSGDE